jgi:hypothetical protein
MTKCLIYKDTKSTVYFCVDGKIYFESNGSYVEANDVLTSLEKMPKRLRTKTFIEKIGRLKKLLTMGYQEGAKYHLEQNKLNLRKGKLFEGEFNVK